MGKQQVHKRLDTEAVKDILVRYDEKRLDLVAAMALLGVKRSRFFKLLSLYRGQSGFVPRGLRTLNSKANTALNQS